MSLTVRSPANGSHVEEARAHLGRRKHTSVVLAEELITVAREEVVEVVAQRPRHHLRREEELPEAAEVGRDLQRRVRADVDALAARRRLDVDDRVHAAQLRVAFDHAQAVVALESREAYLAAAVVVENHLHRLVAEAAHAVVEQDGRADGSFYHEFAFSRSGGFQFAPGAGRYSSAKTLPRPRTQDGSKARFSSAISRRCRSP